MTKKQIRGDIIISFAVMIQSLLIVLQTIMISFFYMDSEATTGYRVVLTAIPMIAAMVITIKRNSFRFFIGIIIAVTILFLTMVIFPDNSPYVMSQGFRFLLPVIVPSFLCLTVVYDYSIVEKTLYVISWFSFALILLYVYGYFSGIVYIRGYNMAFSFACVLPFVSFYSHRKIYDFIICVFLFIIVIGIGARGGALAMAFYVVFDVFQHKSKWRFVILFFIVSFIALIPFLDSWFDSIGITSRTLTKILDEDITSDSGRSWIWNSFWNSLLNHPFLGIGLYGDRGIYASVPYCHNLFLEILIDFGFIIGGGGILIGLLKLITLYIHSSEINKNNIIKYISALIVPFLTSGSYLVSSNFAIFIGLCFLINRDNKIGNSMIKTTM